MPQNKRPGDDIAIDDDHDLSRANSSAAPNKAARTDDDVYQQQLPVSAPPGKRKAGGGSSRTGQACDRCKIRKIRCDARPGGCSPCLQNNSECKTTDRITGRATSRGHTEQVENENTHLKMYMVELQNQLRENGIEPKPLPNSTQAYYGSTLSYWTQPQQQQQPQQNWDQPQSSNMASTTSQNSRPDRHGSANSALPEFRTGCIGDNYLGVSSENNWLSPIEGTSLALFGTKIDLAEFMPSEDDPASEAMSYSTFLKYSLGRVQPHRPDLPAYEQCKVFSEWYFRSVQNFIPILHRPDYMDLLDRIHNKGHEPSPAEQVMVHMVLAVINFQFSARNANEQARKDAMSHYHYSLSLVPDLVTSHKMEDIQALTMICSQLRNQPRPGAAWWFTNMVMGLAIESGLHRSVKNWPESAMSRDLHYCELRKRVFWSLMLFHVHLSGKLGRPMPLRLEDFDIEMPEPLPDTLPGESETTKWKQCSWSPALAGFKLLRCMIQVYSCIYSIRSTGQYETTVRALEKELEAFQAEIPNELRGGPETTDEDRISALYLELSAAECQIMLHHPSLCRSSSQQVIDRNLEICLQWSSKTLSAAVQLKALKSLDTTWYYATDFLAAIFTTLFASTEKRDQMTSADLQSLRQDTDQWLDVMAEVGTLLGGLSTSATSLNDSSDTMASGPRLQAAIRAIVDHSLDSIHRHIAAKTASAAVASTLSPTESQANTYENANGSAGYYTNGSNSGDARNQNFSDGQQAHQEDTYPSGNQYAYQQSQPNGMAYTPGVQASSYNAAAFASDQDAKPNIEARLVAAVSQSSQPTPTNFMAAFQSPPTVSGGFHSSPPAVPMNGHPHAHGQYPQAGPAAWRQFADNMMTSAGGHDFMHSAGALMSLSGKPPESTMNMAAAATMGSLQIPQSDVQQPWPLMHYHNSSDGQQ